MTAHWSSDRHRLLVVGGTGLLDRHRVGVAASRVPDGGSPALFEAGRTAAVRVMPLPEVPDGVVAVGSGLADELRLSETGPDRWRVSLRAATRAATATLEPMTDGSLETAAQSLRRATDVVGRVLWCAPGDTSWLTADGEPLRVREVTGGNGQPLHGLVEIGDDTELLLFSPSNRTGVDIVVLADCSGSMSVDDVPGAGEPLVRPGLFRRSSRPGGTTVRRSEALRQALQLMLAARLRVAGRVSRIALVKFTRDSQSVFPRAGGMAEMDADTPPTVAAEFRDAIGRLIPEAAGTDIGQALHRAAELLHRHGVPDNDRLIVLVSDGAHWQPKGDDRTGELVAATDDPLSLMDELHQASKIRLHAIGISDPRAFDAWWAQRYGNQPQEVSLVPNHTLLGELITVGGGDPTRIGGLDVLEEYFAGLGAGVSHRVGRPAPGRTPRVQPELAEGVRRIGGVDARSRERLEQLADRVRAVYSNCAEASQRRGVGKLFRPPNRHDDLLHLGEPVLCRRDFVTWISAVYKVFRESLDSRLRTGADYPVPGVQELLGSSSEFDHLMALRNDEMHDSPHGETRTRAGAFYARFTGRYALEPDDAANWSKLQLGALELLLGILQEVERLVNRVSPEPAPAAPQPSEDPEVAVIGWTVS